MSARKKATPDLRREVSDSEKEEGQKEVESSPVPDPCIPLVPYGLGASDIAERVDELLAGFSR